MPRKANDASRAGAVEGVRWFFAEERPGGPPPKPFWLRYIGTDVVNVAEVGLFQQGTTAEVDAAVAARFRGVEGWEVLERPGKTRADADVGE